VSAGCPSRAATAARLSALHARLQCRRQHPLAMRSSGSKDFQPPVVLEPELDPVCNPPAGHFKPISTADLRKAITGEAEVTRRTVKASQAEQVLKEDVKPLRHGEEKFPPILYLESSEIVGDIKILGKQTVGLSVRNSLVSGKVILNNANGFELGMTYDTVVKGG
jgi:hypothetical protein